MSAGARVARKALKRLRERRQALGMSQAVLAEAIQVNTSYIGLLERGERVPSLDVLVELTVALDLDLASLFADSDDETRKPELAEISRLRTLLASWPTRHRMAAVRVVEEMGKLLQ